MEAWINCGESFIKADVVRWTEAVFDRPLTRYGRKRKTGKAIHVGEREIAAEVLREPDAKGFVTLLVRACRTVSAREHWPVEQLKLGIEIRRQKKTLLNGNIARKAWDDEGARAMVVSAFLGNT